MIVREPATTRSGVRGREHGADKLNHRSMVKPCASMIASGAAAAATREQLKRPAAVRLGKAAGWSAAHRGHADESARLWKAMWHGRQTFFGTLLGHLRDYPLISLHYFPWSIATVKRRERSRSLRDRPRRKARRSRLARATKQKECPVGAPSTPRSGCNGLLVSPDYSGFARRSTGERRVRRGKTNPDAGTRRGNEEAYAV